MTVRTICGRITDRECGELLYDRKFPLRLIEAVDKSYARPGILHESDAWCQKEEEMKIL